MAALAAVLLAVVALPAEIRDHYRDYNFVNAFSTVQERRLVAESRQAPTDERLGRVAEAMARLAARIVGDDRGILGPRPRTLPENALRSDLLRVTSFEIDDARGEAWVRLEALRLDRTANITLVARFDDLATNRMPPTVDQLAA